MGGEENTVTIECHLCGSKNTRVKAYRENSVSYACKDCEGHFSQQTEADESVIEERSKNQRVVRAQVVRPKEDPPSSSDIFERFGFDENEWEVRKYRYREAERYTNADGFFTLYNVEADIVRKVALADSDIPPISPVSIKASKPKIKLPEKGKKLRRALLLPDPHIGYRRDLKSGILAPYHDRAVWDIVFQILSYQSFDEIIVMGDMLDLPEMSDKFLRTPDMHATTQPAIIESAWLLRQLRLFAPRAKIIYLEGNHEKRLPNIMMSHLSAVYGLQQANTVDEHASCSVPSLLDFSGSRVEWVGNYPDNAFWLNENLRVIHGDKSKRRSGQTAEGYLEHARSSVVFGHIHRRERASKTLHHRNGPKVYESACPGMMGGADRVPASTIEHDWQQGMAVVDYQKGDGGFDIRLIAIHEGREALYDGKVFKGKDYVESLVSDSGWSAFR